MENTNKVVIWVCFSISAKQIKDKYEPVFFKKDGIYDSDRYAAIEKYLIPVKDTYKARKYFRLSAFEFNAENIIDLFNVDKSKYSRINPIEVVDYVYNGYGAYSEVDGNKTYLDVIEKSNDEEYTKTCKCGAKSKGDAICPYDEEINGVQNECDCCEDCQRNCAYEI